jgi:hypothetical protein
MEDLIASLNRMNIAKSAKPTPAASRQVLTSAVHYLYHENIQLKQEIARLRSLLQVIDEPCIPEWVH